MHLLSMLLFAALVSTVFAGISGTPDNLKKSVFYGLRIFGLFMGVGLAIAWILYFIP